MHTFYLPVLNDFLSLKEYIIPIIFNLDIQKQRYN